MVARAYIVLSLPLFRRAQSVGARIAATARATTGPSFFHGGIRMSYGSRGPTGLEKRGLWSGSTATSSLGSSVAFACMARSRALCTSPTTAAACAGSVHANTNALPPENATRTVPPCAPTPDRSCVEWTLN